MKKIKDYLINNVVFIHHFITMLVTRLCVFSVFLLLSPFVWYFYKLLHAKFGFYEIFPLFENSDFNFAAYFSFAEILIFTDIIFACIFCISYLCTLSLLRFNSSVRKTLLPSFEAAVEYSVITARVKMITILKRLKSIFKILTICVFFLSILPFVIALCTQPFGSPFSLGTLLGICLIFLYESFIPVLFFLFIYKYIAKDITRQMQLHLRTSNPKKLFNSIIGVNFDALNGYEFEEYCAVILTKLSFEYVEVTKKTNDQGVDITAFRDGYKYAIQCKCYQEQVGNKAVQEVVAGKRIYNCQMAIVITNNYFTRQAKELAKANDVILWDRNTLVKKIHIASLVPDNNN